MCGCARAWVGVSRSVGGQGEPDQRAGGQRLGTGVQRAENPSDGRVGWLRSSTKTRIPSLLAPLNRYAPAAGTSVRVHRAIKNERPRSPGPVSRHPSRSPSRCDMPSHLPFRSVCEKADRNAMRADLPRFGVPAAVWRQSGVGIVTRNGITEQTGRVASLGAQYALDASSWARQLSVSGTGVWAMPLIEHPEAPRQALLRCATEQPVG
jgi:hypothetical protein